jgi:PP-loop superfamily ATP-utilizing enzyme
MLKRCSLCGFRFKESEFRRIEHMNLESCYLCFRKINMRLENTLEQKGGQNATI